MKKRLTALLLALTLALGALPAAALEEAPPAVPAEAAAHSLERDDPQPGPDERPDEEARPAPDEDGGAAPETAGGPDAPQTDPGESAGTTAAVVDGQGYPSLEEALAVLAPGGQLRLAQDAVLDAMLEITVPDVTFDLGGFSLTPSSDFGPAAGNVSHLLNIAADGITLQNGTLAAGPANKHVVNVYRAADVTLQDLTLDHTGAAAGAPLVVHLLGHRAGTAGPDGGPPLLVRRERGQGRGHPGLCAGQRPDAGAAGRHRPGGDLGGGWQRRRDRRRAGRPAGPGQRRLPSGGEHAPGHPRAGSHSRAGGYPRAGTGPHARAHGHAPTHPAPGRHSPAHPRTHR
ncbi:MAG TPA: hypothetical protein H9773_09070 [Candidatus Fournierella merdavium]|nr:hypothetical protein [Candidatus Fournierella merdavium]